MTYTETTEQCKNIHELTEEVMYTLRKMRDSGLRKIDGEIVINLENFSITVVTPKETDDN